MLGMSHHMAGTMPRIASTRCRIAWGIGFPVGGTRTCTWCTRSDRMWGTARDIGHSSSSGSSRSILPRSWRHRWGYVHHRRWGIRRSLSNRSLHIQLYMYIHLLYIPPSNYTILDNRHYLNNINGKGSTLFTKPLNVRAYQLPCHPQYTHLLPRYNA